MNQDFSKSTRGETMVGFAINHCLHHRFELQATSTPTAIALIWGEQQLTYHDLNRRANQLANALRAFGVGPDRPVGLCLDRSFEMIIGMLAIMKAGGCYVPLDPAYPQERLALMTQTADLQILLTSQTLWSQLSTLAQSTQIPTILYLDQAWSTLALASDENPAVAVQSEHLLYILFTSGSTGTPKGVAMPHRALTNLVEWQHQQLPTTLGMRTLQFTPLSFDVATQEIFATLCFGGTLVLMADAVRHNPQALCKLLQSEEINRLFLPFVALQQLAEAAQGQRPKALRTVITAGEQLQITPAIAQFFRQSTTDQPICTLHNHYGPTESHVVTAYTLPADVDHWPPLPSIGRPVANVQIYLLNEAQEIVPVGEIGELYIGGVCLARGYYQRPDLTQERFIDNPFAPGKLYKTGDLARYLADGNLEYNLEYIGRSDQQVKIRGFRVELGEIEVLLAHHPHIREAVVVAHTGVADQKRLVAYIVPQDDLASHKTSVTQSEQVAHWQQIWEATYHQAMQTEIKGVSDPTLNTAGWRDSYDGQPIPPDQMREWVETTVQRILSYHPKRVLEIGCGSGMLLFRIAPYCEKYVGTDISQAALTYIAQQLQQLSGQWHHVEVQQQAADHIARFEPASFDTVIINSVVPLFPSIHYLVDVLEKAVGVVSPGGRIFVGDVRNLAFLKIFHTSTQLHRASGTLTTSELRQNVQIALRQEPQLLVDPDFFDALQQHLPQINHVETQLRRGQYHNEMTRFRYDAVLHISDLGGSHHNSYHNSHRNENHDIFTQPVTHWLNWQQEQMTMAKVQQILANEHPTQLCIRHIPNLRVQECVKMTQILYNDYNLTTIDQVRANIAASLQHNTGPYDKSGIDPEVWWQLENEYPYTIHLRGSGEDHEDSYDVICQRIEGIPHRIYPHFVEKIVPRPWTTYANQPMQALHTDLESEVRQYLQQHLPDYMLPSAFLILPRLPLTPSGKVDRRALPAPDVKRPQLKTILRLPQTDIESQIALLWQKTLRIDSVGIDDNFFELGGTSLLLTRLYSELVLHFPEVEMVDLLQYPTIHRLAEQIERRAKGEMRSKPTQSKRLDYQTMAMEQRTQRRRHQSAHPKHLVKQTNF